MDLVIPPTIYVAGPKPNDPTINRISGRQPIRQPPVAEPAESPTRESRVKAKIDPVSLPPVLDAKGRLAKPTGTGTQLDVLA